MKIVCPTDGSGHSVAALRQLVLRLAWFAQSPQIAVINVHPHLPYARAVAWAGKDAARRYYDEESAAALAPATALLDEQGIPYERVQRIGEPAHEIVRFATEWNADLIAMGRYGHSAVATLLMGSVTQKVLATTKLPVLLLQ
jgi:nucleotide-binding universal stress UspA family protein